MILKYLIEKEFRQIARNAFVPRILVAMPLAMMLVFPWAADQEVRDVRVAVVDGDHSTTSQRLVGRIAASPYFELATVAQNYPQALQSVESGDSDIILQIAHGFERSMVEQKFSQIRPEKSHISITANAVNGTKSMLGTAWLTALLANANGENSADVEKNMASQGVVSGLVSTKYRFNPRLDYKVFMVPALMVMLLTMLCGFLPALSIVAEKESGTIEQINVSPVRRRDFVLSKLVPYWSIGFVVLGFCMTATWLVYGLVPAGNVLSIMLFSGIYLLVVSGMGLVVSNHSDTLQQAMFVMFFFIMILLLMSGLFTPVSSMPGWAQAIAAINPLKYFIEVMRAIYLKGSGLRELLPQLGALIAFAAAFNAWAIGSYRKNS